MKIGLALEKVQMASLVSLGIADLTGIISYGAWEFTAAVEVEVDVYVYV